MLIPFICKWIKHYTSKTPSFFYWLGQCGPEKKKVYTLPKKTEERKKKFFFSNNFGEIESITFSFVIDQNYLLFNTGYWTHRSAK